MSSSDLLRPPGFSRLRSLIVRRSIELFLVIVGTVLCWSLWDVVPPDFSRSLFEPFEVVVLLGAGSACLLFAWRMRSRQPQQSAAANSIASLDTGHAVALVALPSEFPLAALSRLPLLARLLRTRLEFAGDAIAIKYRFGARRIAYADIARADWQHDGVLLLLGDGRRLLIPTCRPPRFSGPSGHYPELRHAVQAATFATLGHNQAIAQRIQAECERADGASYRRAARMLD